MEKLSPYIGINGGSWQHVEKEYLIQNESPERKVLMGVQATEKTQVNNQENKYGKDWHPVGDSMKRWWLRSGWNQMLHVNTESKVPSAVAAVTRLMLERTIVTVWDETDLGTEYSELRSYCKRIQFNNLPFYEHDYYPMFEMFATDSSSKTGAQQIVLQANAESMDALTPAKFAKEIKRYEPVIAGVLLDGSGGKGIPLRAAQLRRYIDRIYDMDIAVGIAGGLSEETVEPLAGKLLQQYPSLSIDAESGLRTNYSRENPAKSEFSPEKAKAFVAKVTQLLQGQDPEQNS